MAFFFPGAYATIDWQQPYEFLDKEVQQVMRVAKSGRHTVDKLVRVTVQDGAVALVLVHIESQSVLKEIEAGEKMSYITTIERRAAERGLEKGIEQGLEKGIDKGSQETAREAVIEAILLRFQDVLEELLATLRNLSDLQRLKGLFRQAILAGSLEEFEHALETGGQR